MSVSEGYALTEANLSKDPHCFTQNPVTDAAMNPVSRHNVDIDAKPSG